MQPRIRPRTHQKKLTDVRIQKQRRNHVISINIDVLREDYKHGFWRDFYRGRLSYNLVCMAMPRPWV